MHDQIDFSIDGLSSGLRRMLSRWRSRAVTSITATTCTSTFCCKRAVEDGIMPVNPVPATVYTHCRSKRLTVQWERFRSLFERAPDGSDFIIYSAVGGVLDPDHLSAYWRDVLDGLKLPHVRFHGRVIIGTSWKVSVNTRGCTNLVLIFKATPHNWTRAISAKRRSFHCAVLP